MNEIVNKWKKYSSIKYLKNILLKRRNLTFRNPYTFINYDRSLIIKNCSQNKNFLDEIESKFIEHILNKTTFQNIKPNSNFQNKEILERDDFVETKNLIILLKTGLEKINKAKHNSNNNIIYNCIKKYLVKENVCEDIIHYVECHPTKQNFNLLFKFFQINNEISIHDYENHEYYKNIVNINLEKFDLLNIINLKQMLILNKKMLFRFYFDFFSKKINLNKINEIYFEKINSNKCNLTKSLNEGVDLINFLFELISLNINEENFWIISKKILIKLSNDNRNPLNIFEHIFCLYILSIKSIGSKSFYLKQLDLIKRHMIRKIIQAEFQKIEMNVESLELLLNMMISLIFNLRILHNIHVESHSKTLGLIILKYVSLLKESTLEVVDVNSNHKSIERVTRLINELKYILNKPSVKEEENFSFFYSYYSIIRINRDFVERTAGAIAQDILFESVKEHVKNLRHCYDSVMASQFSSEDNIFSEFSIKLNFNLLNELNSVKLNFPNAVDNKFIIEIVNNLLKQFNGKKKEFEIANKNVDSENENFKKLEKLKIFLIRIHKIIKPSNYFNDRTLKDSFLSEAKNIIIARLNTERHLQHLSKLHKELIEYDKKYSEALQDLKQWESYNKNN